MDKPFHIFELTKELVDDIISRTYDSHFHDFEELIIISQGSLEHFIDFQKEIVDGPFACYVSMGKMHKLIPHNDLRGWVVKRGEFLVDADLRRLAHAQQKVGGVAFHQFFEKVPAGIIDCHFIP